MLAAHPVRVVDGVEDDRPEGVLPFGDLGADGEKLLPARDRDLVGLEVVQARLGREEEGALGAGAELGLPELVRAVEQHGDGREVGLGGVFSVGSMSVSCWLLV